jgi:hypothetical protein
MELKTFLCECCKHFYDGLGTENWTGGHTCPAFPDGIPEDILLNEFLHSEKHPEQGNDILFEADDEIDSYRMSEQMQILDYFKTLKQISESNNE